LKKGGRGDFSSPVLRQSLLLEGERTYGAFPFRPFPFPFPFPSYLLLGCALSYSSIK
jgi:hypothetical protein